MHPAARAPPRRHAGRPHHGDGLRGRAAEDRGLAAGGRGIQAGAAHAGQLHVDASPSWSALATSSSISRGTSRRSTCWPGAASTMSATSTRPSKSGIPYGDIENKSPYERSLYSRQMRIRLLKNRLNSRSSPSPTAIIDHGANPGLVSHFTKRALLEIADDDARNRAAGGDRRRPSGVREAHRRRREPESRDRLRG